MLDSYIEVISPAVYFGPSWDIDPAAELSDRAVGSEDLRDLSEVEDIRIPDVRCLNRRHVTETVVISRMTRCEDWSQGASYWARRSIYCHCGGPGILVMTDGVVWHVERTGQVVKRLETDDEFIARLCQHGEE